MPAQMVVLLPPSLSLLDFENYVHATAAATAAADDDGDVGSTSSELSEQRTCGRL